MLDANGVINCFDSPKCTFISMEHYFATLMYHIIEKKNDGKICISKNYLASIQNSFKEINKIN